MSKKSMAYIKMGAMEAWAQAMFMGDIENYV